MTETEPKFLARLTEKFSEPMRMVRNEHDYTDTEAYAEEFVRAVVRLARPGCSNGLPAAAQSTEARPGATPQPARLPPPAVPRFRVAERSGVWEVLVDGRFHGQDLKEGHALAACYELARQAPGAPEVH